MVYQSQKIFREKEKSFVTLPHTINIRISAMKILHTSDWHIGQSFYRYERDDEHRHFFNQLAEIVAQERPDAIVVCGDVYHNAAPSAQSQKLMVEGVLKLKQTVPEMEIVITAGNHDSGSRIDADKRLWQVAGVHVIGGVNRKQDGTFDPSQFLIEIPGKGIIAAAPYFHPSNYPAIHTDTARNERAKEFFGALLKECSHRGLPIVMMAHLAVKGCDYLGHEDVIKESDNLVVGGIEAEDISVLGQGYDYLALGHIHKPQRTAPLAYYSGSPLPVSFAEEYDHFVNIVEIIAHGEPPKVTSRRLSPLREVKTIPPEGAPLEQALEYLSNLPSSDTSYIRLLVDQDSALPANAYDMAADIVRNKSCRLCEVHRKIRQRESTKKSSIQIDEVADLDRYTPIEIASDSYQRATGEKMPENLLNLLKEVIDDVRRTTN